MVRHIDEGDDIDLQKRLNDLIPDRYFKDSNVVAIDNGLRRTLDGSESPVQYEDGPSLPCADLKSDVTHLFSPPRMPAYATYDVVPTQFDADEGSARDAIASPIFVLREWRRFDVLTDVPSRSVVREAATTDALEEVIEDSLFLHVDGELGELRAICESSKVGARGLLGGAPSS